YLTAYASPPGSSHVRLEWDPSPDPETMAYRIYRGLSASSSDHAFLAEVPLSQTSYIDAGLSQGISRYFVRTVDEAGLLSPPASAQQIATLPDIRLVGDGKPDFSISGWVEVADITGDGKAELFTTRTHATEGHVDYSYALYAESGGVWTNLWALRRGSIPPLTARPVRLEDATGDGRADLLVPFDRLVNLAGSNVQRRVFELWPSIGSGFSTNPTFSLAVHPNEIDDGILSHYDWGDPDGDGDLDLLIVPFGPDRRAAVFLNQSGLFAGTPAWTSPVTNIDAGGFGNQNNDGMDDLLIGADINNAGQGSRQDFYVHAGTPAGPSATATWMDLSPGTDAVGNPEGISWADFDRRHTFQNIHAYPVLDPLFT
ncbi:MAG: hypothetical protein AAF492_30515, partial [Verrucomicrobiota bacterium]